MKIRKVGAIIIACCLLAGHSLTPAYATSHEYGSKIEQNLHFYSTENQITPRWTYVRNLFPELSSSGKTLYPEVTVDAWDSDATITGTMYLEKEVSSGNWTSVRTWSIRGTGDAYVDGNYTGTSGITYRTRVTVYVNGEKAEATSNERSL